MSSPTSPSAMGGEIQVEGYCVHCRSRRLMQSAIQVSNRRGGRDLKGHCSVCGKAMYRLGGWDTLSPVTPAPETPDSEM
jgi:hypothetical protein